MEMRTVVITGAAGLGLATAEAMARLEGWHVALAVRDAGRGEQAAALLRGKVPGARVSVLPLDLASMASIRAFPGELTSARLPPLRSLVCNAGLQEVGEATRSADGLETTFAVNHLGHFLLANLLLSQFSGAGGRIVFVASGVHDPAQRTGMPPPRYASAALLAADLEPGRVAGQRRYTTSKLCNVLCTYELARRLAASGRPALQAIRVDAFDPGLMPGTGLARGYSGLARFAWSYLFPVLRLFHPNVNSTGLSGRRLAALAASSGAESGRYFSAGKVTRSSETSYDEAKARELWEGSRTLTALSAAESPLVVAAPVVVPRAAGTAEASAQRA